jgi:serine/threonine protein kinase
MHENNIAHRDLKLDNIIIDDSHPRSRIIIIDFGFSMDTHKKLK